MKLKQAKKNFYIDKGLIFFLLTFAVISLVAIHTATPLSNLGNLVEKQAQWIVIGYIFMVVLMYFGKENIYYISKLAYIALMFALVLLVLDRYIDLPLITPVKGATAWFQFPGIGSFQPSEFMKVILIILSADIIDKHNIEKTGFGLKDDISLFIKILILIVPPIFLILLQPDTGLPLIMLASIIVMLFISGINRIWVYIGGGTIIVAVIAILYLFYFNKDLLANILGDAYKLNRFYGWLETEKYYLSHGAQLYNALVAIGSAGFYGHGLMSNVIHMLEPQNDFIYAVIGQDFGFVGLIVIMLFIMAFNIKLIIVASKYKYNREKYFVAGVLGMLMFQQIVNMGMVVGLFPITGITLPFISYGGSSFLSYMIPIAMIFLMANENIADSIH